MALCLVVWRSLRGCSSLWTLLCRNVARGRSPVVLRALICQNCREYLIENHPASLHLTPATAAHKIQHPRAFRAEISLRLSKLRRLRSGIKLCAGFSSTIWSESVEYVHVLCSGHCLASTSPTKAEESKQYQQR